MPGGDRYISASEIGTWCYCKKTWHLAQQGYPSALITKRSAGTQYHEKHGHDLNVAIRQRAAARVVVVVCVLMLGLLALARMWFAR
jgi:hypothetical protein